MHTRVYNGLKVKDGVDLFELITKIADNLDTLRMDISTGAVVEKTTTILDALAVGIDPASVCSPSSARYFEGTERTISDYFVIAALDVTEENNKNQVFYTDLRQDALRLTFMGLRNSIYAVYESNSRILTDALMKMDEIREYGYWETSARPKGVSVAEWEQRKANWAAIYPTTRDGRRSSLTWETAGEMVIPRWVDAVSLIGKGDEWLREKKTLNMLALRTVMKIPTLLSPASPLSHQLALVEDQLRAQGVYLMIRPYLVRDVRDEKQTPAELPSSVGFDLDTILKDVARQLSETP